MVLLRLRLGMGPSLIGLVSGRCVVPRCAVHIRSGYVRVVGVCVCANAPAPSKVHVQRRVRGRA